MARKTWLVDERTIAKKVKNPIWSSALSHCKDTEWKHECPSCHHPIKNSEEWPGLPAGVKFDPSHAELLDHLAAKCGVGDVLPHVLIDEFIPTLEQDHGICYTHPKYLPGSRKDGSSMHFFHKTINAYASGQRKRRKIEHNISGEDVRWHKTGKTRPVLENGVFKGWKKIMVLYKTSKKGTKPDKSNWVMHQYHLGIEKDEKEGEYVVSKITYEKPKENDMTDTALGPKTPKTNAPRVLIPKSSPIDDVENDYIDLASDECKGWLVSESQAREQTAFLEVKDLLCRESFDLLPHSSDQGLNQIFNTVSTSKTSEAAEMNSAPCGLSDLEKLDFDSPPDLIHALSDLPLGSQEGIYDWLHFG